MKKIILVCGMFIMLIFMGCQNKSVENGEAEFQKQEEVEKETEKETEADTSSKGEITVENLMEQEPSPVEDFEFYEDENGELVLSGYCGDDELVVIPEEKDGKKIVMIGKYVFGNESPVKGVRLSDNIKTIEASAFGLNKVLEIIICGKGLEVIGEGAFYECDFLKTVQLNDGLKKIDAMAFAGCENIKVLDIPHSVEEVGGSIWWNGGEKNLICGKAGSVVEEYANIDGIPFEAN